MVAKRVLIVDDALELGRLLQAALVSLDSSLIITVVPSAEEALLEAARRPVDLVITDIRLPGISGLDLTRRLHSRNKDTRIIQITGLTDASIRQQSIDAGADYFFKKPLSMSDFLNAVEKLLGMTKVEPPPPAVEKLPPPQTDRMTESQAATRRSIAAYAVALLDDHGHILVQHGELPERELDPNLLSALIATLNTGEKVSRYLGSKTSEATFTFKGRAFDLVASPLGSTFTILVVLKAGRSSVRLSIAVDEILNVRKELERILADMGVSVQPQSPSRVTGPLNPEKVQRRTTGPLNPEKAPLVPRSAPAKPEIVPNIPPAQASFQPSAQPEQPSAPENAGGLKPEIDLEALLKSPTKEKIKSEDVNAFWDAAENDEAASHLVLPDKITLEQARKMGLAPDIRKTSS